MAHSKSGARNRKARAEFLMKKLGAFIRSSTDRSQARIYWALVGFLVLVFLIGGASRSDVQSLMFLRPAAILFCGFALLTISADQIRAYRFIFWMAGLIFLLAGVHLIPLPPGIWQAMPEREIIVQIDRAAGLKDVWRPITMTPSNGANALYSLFVPLAVLLLAVQLDSDQLKKLVLPILIIGALSGIIGIFQAAGNPNGSLYFYRITNNGSAVGLFSNRNHQAVLLMSMFPMLAFFASNAMKTENAIKMRQAFAIGGVAMLIPLILVTGSRLGIILGLFAIVCGGLIYHRPEATGVRRRTEKKNYTIPIMVFLGLMLLVLVTVLASRAEGLKRLIGTNVGEEDRAEAWRLVWRLAMGHMPVGTGSGSFVQLFQQVEPMRSLTSVYFNHAHNDWLEVWMTFGVPGVLLLLAAGASYLIALRSLFGRRKQSSSDLLLGRTGAAVVLLAAAASFVDYPLRTPSLACLFVVACCWMAAGLRAAPITAGHRSGD